MSGSLRRRSRRTVLKVAAATLAGCGGATLPGRPRPDPPVIWRDPFGERFSVVIDPGHGGRDSGTRSESGLLEKDLTLDVARRLRALLERERDVDVTLTRDRDAWLPRLARIATVRAADADLLISLHFNVLPERDIALVETYYAHARNIVESRTLRRERAAPREAARAVDPDEPNDVSFTRGSERFAALVQRHVHAAVAEGNGRAVDAGVKRDTLFVLTRAATSGALVELTCLSNPLEAERLAGEPYRERLAAALAKAIREYRALSNVVEPVELDM